jgi:NADPH2:quinone reductase
MRAIKVTAFGSSGTLEVVEVDRPEPGPGEVLIEVEAIGVNFSDVMAREGEYYGGPEPPYVPGTEVAGTVAAVGEGVDRAAGDRVAALVSMAEGAYREFVAVDAGAVLDVPAGLSFAEAAGFPVQFTTAHNALFGWGGLEAGDRVLVHSAAGGVGTAAVQLADAAGAEVFGTASTAAKLEHAAGCGADHTINYVEENFATRVAEITDGAGLDLVLDGVGGETFERSLDALASFGRLVSYGKASGENVDLDPRDVLFRNREIVGYHLGDALARRPGEVLAALDDLAERLAAGEVTVFVDRSFPLEEAAAAHEYIEGRNTVGKTVLTTRTDPTW